MTNKPISVDGHFTADGVLRIKRILYNGRWLPITPGRQGQDQNGPWQLIMLPDQTTHRLHFNLTTHQWTLHTITPPQQYA
ncbi:MAG TPA: hypothetical protein VLL52_08820 [Anaerolineae bacterium]|nr:hypothetical protein [Anaerolineae bacterium]